MQVARGPHKRNADSRDCAKDGKHERTGDTGKGASKMRHPNRPKREPDWHTLAPQPPANVRKPTAIPRASAAPAIAPDIATPASDPPVRSVSLRYCSYHNSASWNVRSTKVTACPQQTPAR